jgi:preprotein translocase subunit SecY
MGKWTRFLTLVLSLFQSALFARHALYMNASTPGIIFDRIAEIQLFGVPWLFFLLVMTTMTAGTLLLMWIGERITEKGIGNGMSMIITLGILSSLPSTVGSVIKQLNLDSQEPGQMTFSSLVVLGAAFVVIILGTILVIQGVRKIPLQYARRSGSDAEHSDHAYIPLKINYAGVIPVIFASSLLMFPATIAQFLGRTGVFGEIASMLSPGSSVYTLMYVLLIVFFTYFWTATQFHPEQIASDMKKNGAFIPGVRQGKPTEEYLEKSMSRLTLVGALFLALIAILPNIVSRVLGVDPTISHFFGGTSLLILIGVVLDTTKQMESHLLMNRYDGFMMKKKVRL